MRRPEATVSDTDTRVGNPLYDLWREQLDHQRAHAPSYRRSRGHEITQPELLCMGCVEERRRDSGRTRDEASKRYAWAVPDEAAIAAIVNHSPYGVVEIGAGTGYWAKLLYDAGCDVAAFDLNPPGEPPRQSGPDVNTWHADQEPWYPVEYGMSTAVQYYPQRTLLLVWPPYGDVMAYHAAVQYEGDTIVYVGEGSGGCTADGRFHKLVGADPCWHYDDDFNDLESDPDCDTCTIEPQWREVEVLDIPQWSGLHDRMYIYKRIS
jgi:hypothetical protein